eukprot:Plantae.Rhodophyta-Purpureofilum_apyrenoidigerum.ctg10853.p1 GENE.Plantae.Rhodophyta-Purpureofilum_apyrenoidigerum.ctg10853~~Plantae.Rhodophyta-Purpureofilum_apyrenoidigerum.ctg10853.p1  ORF type:complete len:245 (-),score=35.65 Plantae.Rhodophyta-Purpureofilum_apyrenoidigerum.ctg10853:94-828(-)
MAIGFVSGFSLVPKRMIGVSSRRGRTVVMANDLDRDRKNVVSTPEEETTKASEFIDNVQNRFERYTEQIQNVDFSDLQYNASKSSKRLATNFMAGEWLARGETFGVLQIITALLILRGQGGFDPLFALIFGPGVLLTGAFICVKSVADLGYHQISIWPKPVPDGTLKTEGAYSIVRHPIYSGVLLSSLGFSISSGSPARFALTLALGYLFMRKIGVEEEFLAEEYEGYGEYQEDVPYKLIPKIF